MNAESKHLGKFSLQQEVDCMLKACSLYWRHAEKDLDTSRKRTF